MDPILLEVINNRLQSISNEMEDALLKMSFSVIVKEMKDCTCALFDAQGRTISQSAAMPCQLGFLSSSGNSPGGGCLHAERPLQRRQPHP